MRPTRTAPPTNLFLAGAGLGLAVISALAGWRVAAPPAVGSIASVRSATAPQNHSDRRPTQASTGAGTRSPTSAPSPVPVATATSFTPVFQPAAAKAAPNPDPQAASQRYIARARAATLLPPEPLDPYVPGHSLAVAGQRVYVESMQYHPPTGQTAMDLAVLPESPSASPADPSTGLHHSPFPERVGRGYSYEEELFRAKWGWESYNAIVDTAQGIAAGTAKP